MRPIAASSIRRPLALVALLVAALASLATTQSLPFASAYTEDVLVFTSVALPQTRHIHIVVAAGADAVSTSAQIGLADTSTDEPVRHIISGVVTRDATGETVERWEDNEATHTFASSDCRSFTKCEESYTASLQVSKFDNNFAGTLDLLVTIYVSANYKSPSGDETKLPDTTLTVEIFP